MKRKSIFNIVSISLLFIIVVSCSKKNVYHAIKSDSQCSEKGGYWYNNQCWNNFEDEGIPKSKIDSVVSAELKIIEKSIFTIGNNTYPLVAFLPIEEDGDLLFIAVYGTKGNFKTLILPTGEKKNKIKIGAFETSAMLFSGDAIAGTMEEKLELSGTATVEILNLDNLDIEISGNILDADENSMNFSFQTNESISGAGNSHIEIKENEAYLSGDLGTVTYAQIKDLIKNNPKVKTIVMTHISGSVNDAINMHTGRLLNENGFTTKVLANSDIASGGVDLFCAGKKRIVEQGAKIGIHSWCCVNDLTASEIPKEHPAHQYQIEYFTMALGLKKGPEFYFYTLEAAPFDSVHYMTDKEIQKWNISTLFIESK